MNDKSPKSTESEPADGDDEALGPLAGQRLANARRENDISISDIAKELHLDESKVQALEENQFEVLGAPVFAKGHLRKYAELVGVPTDDILADYYKLNRSVGAPPVVGPKKMKPPRDIALGRWIGGAVAALLVVVAVYWWLNREPAPRVNEVAGVLEPFVSDRADGLPDTANEHPAADETPVDPDAVDTGPPASGGETAGISDQSPDLEPAAPDQPVAAASANQIQIVMTFSGDCWTEVTDANGERLYFGLGAAGQTVTRNGTPPFRALFGNADNVRVTVNGVYFPISGGSRRGNTARVTINDR